MVCEHCLMSVPPVIPRLADRDHYREMPGRLRALARLTRSPGIRRELVDLAKRYDRRGDHIERRSRQEVKRTSQSGGGRYDTNACLPR
jgi:hypothetical protein